MFDHEPAGCQDPAGTCGEVGQYLCYAHSDPNQTQSTHFPPRRLSQHLGKSEKERANCRNLGILIQVMCRGISAGKWLSTGAK